MKNKPLLSGRSTPSWRYDHEQYEGTSCCEWMLHCIEQIVCANTTCTANSKNKQVVRTHRNRYMHFQDLAFICLYFITNKLYFKYNKYNGPGLRHTSVLEIRKHKRRVWKHRMKRSGRTTRPAMHTKTIRINTYSKQGNFEIWPLHSWNFRLRKNLNVLRMYCDQSSEICERGS